MQKDWWSSHQLDFLKTGISHYYFVKLTSLNYQDSAIAPKKIGSYLSSESAQYMNVPWGLSEEKLLLNITVNAPSPCFIHGLEAVLHGQNITS